MDVIKKVLYMSSSQGQIYMYSWKGIATGKTFTKYESPRSNDWNVIAIFTVMCHFRKVVQTSISMSSKVKLNYCNSKALWQGIYLWNYNACPCGLGNQRSSQKKVRGQEHVNFILYGWKGLATRRTHAMYKKPVSYSLSQG